jgi:23S rRNA pseudouridine1911/1915/1917 synthase
MPDALTPNEMRFESEVRSEQRNLPLCKALAARFTYHTIEQWRERIEAGDVLHKGEVATPEQLVHTGDSVTYIVRNYTEPSVPTHYEILYEDEEFLVAGKPAGVPVHHAGSIFWNTFASILRRGTGNPELVPMHRLDRDTSGVMLFAKSTDTSIRYQKNLHRIMLRKLYLAVVDGDFSTAPLTDGVLDVQIPLLEQPGSAIKVQMIPDPENGKACRTVFRPLGTALGERPISAIECELFTGRKHQIRAHLAALGFPILGDCIYSHEGRFYLKRCDTPLTPEDFAILGAPMQMLHAWKIELQLPSWREPRWFTSKLYTPEMGVALEKILGPVVNAD